jgi:hypothetical protein
MAQEYFACVGPPEAQPLPVNYYEIERMKRDYGLRRLVAYYALSLFQQDFDERLHPELDEYASGVMASEFAPDFFKNDEELRERYPPCPLEGLSRYMNWRPNEPLTESKSPRAASNRRPVSVSS